MFKIITRMGVLADGLCMATPGSAKKMVMAMESVILHADLIVIGEVESVGTGSYSFRISETVSGPADLQTIRVEKWEEWTCDQRGFVIKPGQKLLLLLDKSGSHYGPINDSTREIALRNDSVPARSGFYDVLPRPVSTAEFSEAARALRACCHITSTSSDDAYDYHWAWDCTPEERTARSSRNDLIAWLFARMEKREANKRVQARD